VASVLDCAEVVPAGHDEQAALPEAGLYLPAPHAEHVPPTVPENPALHRQADTVPLPAEDSEPAGQLIHEPAPEGLYVPATHSVHCPPLEPLYPERKVKLSGLIWQLHAVLLRNCIHTTSSHLLYRSRQ
jgi:hypothetical protein